MQKFSFQVSLATEGWCWKKQGDKQEKLVLTILKTSALTQYNISTAHPTAPGTKLVFCLHLQSPIIQHPVGSLQHPPLSTAWSVSTTTAWPQQYCTPSGAQTTTCIKALMSGFALTFQKRLWDANQAQQAAPKTFFPYQIHSGNKLQQWTLNTLKAPHKN